MLFICICLTFARKDQVNDINQNNPQSPQEATCHKVFHNLGVCKEMLNIATQEINELKQQNQMLKQQASGGEINVPAKQQKKRRMKNKQFHVPPGSKAIDVLIQENNELKMRVSLLESDVETLEVLFQQLSRKINLMRKPEAIDQVEKSQTDEQRQQQQTQEQPEQPQQNKNNWSDDDEQKPPENNEENQNNENKPKQDEDQNNQEQQQPQQVEETKPPEPEPEPPQPTPRRKPKPKKNKKPRKQKNTDM